MNALDFTLDTVDVLPFDIEPAPPTQADIQQFFNILHRGGAWRFVQNLNAGPEHDKRRSVYYRVDELVTLSEAWSNDRANIFHGVNPTIVRREYYQASHNKDIAALNTLFREYDGKDFTDPTPAEIDAQLPTVKAEDEQRVAQAQASDPNSKVKLASEQALRNQARGMAKDAKFKRNPEHYKALAKAHVDSLTPAPSVIVASGGGFQNYWLLAEPFVIRTHPDEPNAHIESYAADLQKRWVQLDPKADQGVHDLRRILRTPGTYNHKSKYAPNYPQVIFYQKRFDLGYSLQGLKTILPAPVAPVTTTAHPQATTAHQDHHSTPYEGASVIDAYNAKHNLASMLVEYGYTHAGDNRYMRPGGKDSPGVELFPTENNARIWSSNDPLYSGDHRCTPFTVFCVYEHDGNVSKAVAVAAVEMALVRHPKTESIKAKLQICRQWAQTADFAALIPQELQSAKGYRTNATDKRLYSAYLDVLGKYGSFRGPISNQQLSLASGLSDGSVRNSKKRLIGANLIRQIEAPEGSDNTGAYWYELVLRPDFDSCVDCAVVDVVSAKPYRAKYATKVFTDNKMHDAFQRGGSKRQRQAATIKAIGPDALLLLDVVNDFGRQTQIEVAMRTHQSKYTVSRLVKRLDEYGIVTVEAEGTRRFVSLNSDWLETVNELAPKMPTYGMEFKRNLNAAVRTVDNCDRLIAKGAGDAEKLEKRREKAAQRAFDMMSCETAFYFDEERQAEIMRRLTRHDALHHGASATVNDMQKSLATANFISFLRSETAKPWMTKYDNGRLTRIAQTLEDNELLIAARHQMFVEDMTLPGQTPPAPTISAAEIYRHHQMALGGAA